MPLSLNLDGTEPAEPAGPSGVVHFRACFVSPTGDPNWVRTSLIGGVLTALGSTCTATFCFWTFSPLTLAPFAGTLGAAADGERTLLPRWANAGDFGRDFVQGLRLFVVCVVYGVVMLLLLLPFAALVYGEAGARLRRAAEELDTLQFLALVSMLLLPGLPVALLLPAALARATIWRTLSAAVELGKVLSFVRANLGNYLRSLLIGFLANIFAVAAALPCLVASLLSYAVLLAVSDGVSSDLLIGLAAVVLGSVIALGVMGAAIALFWSQLVFARALGETVRLHPTSV